MIPKYSLYLYVAADYVSLVQNVWSSLKVNGQNKSKLQLRAAKVTGGIVSHVIHLLII